MIQEDNWLKKWEKYKFSAITAGLSHHHPKSICVACAVDALADTYYFVIENQNKIVNIRPTAHFPLYSENWTYSILISAADSSLLYIANNLLESESCEFEAYLSVSRNMLERLVKIKDIISNPSLINQASDDFKNTISDIKTIFDCVDPKMTAKEFKKSQFLGRGSNWEYVDDKFNLIFAYLSRVAHTYNMDVLLSPKYERFFIKSYLFVVLVELYHKTMSECTYLSKESINLHKEHLSSLEKIWTEKRITPENIIYCTTFYSDVHSNLEDATIKDYLKCLDNAFALYNKDNECCILPKFKYTEK